MESRKITPQEQKQILLDLLKEFQEICKKNNIQYSLVGGSLIGVIRHKGFIPWDDDIDVVLTPEEYVKLLSVIKKYKNDNKKFLLPLTNGYYYPFIKFVDTRTKMVEDNHIPINDYGIHLDIFHYNYLSNNKVLRTIAAKKRTFAKKIYGSAALTKEAIHNMPIHKKALLYTVRIIGRKRMLKRQYNILNASRRKKTNYLFINWPSYNWKKEIQDTKSTQNYIKTRFENIDTKIFEGYDEILKTTFGNYMTPPPQKDRVSNHKYKINWK